MNSSVVLFFIIFVVALVGLHSLWESLSLMDLSFADGMVGGLILGSCVTGMVMEIRRSRAEALKNPDRLESRRDRQS